MRFLETLKNAKWAETKKFVRYTKGEWLLIFDTSSWIEVGTKNNPRVFDVPVPEQGKEEWTLSLIEHLCKVDDELHRLK